MPFRQRLKASARGEAFLREQEAVQVACSRPTDGRNTRSGHNFSSLKSQTTSVLQLVDVKDEEGKFHKRTEQRHDTSESREVAQIMVARL